MGEVNVLQRLVDASKRATTAVVLTHNIDFMFAQAILVNQLRKSGAPRLTVFADAGCAAASFNRQSVIADRVGRSYRVVPIDLGVGRRFHPKAIFLAGEEGTRLAIGSGNLGHGGWSSNREIWTYFNFPGEGGPAIAAFRDYLEKVCGMAGASDAVRATVLDPFRSEAWAADLPEPDRLVELPADTPLMDRMLSQFQEPPASFDMMAPYFDPEGAAVNELAARLGVPMRVLIQHGKEGLSSKAGAKLPSSARIVGIAPGAGERQTIHAKLYAARYTDHVVILAGSANCSRAALLRSDNGNAELMAISHLSNAEYEELLSGIQISDSPPDLPETAPNADWDEIENPPVRVLSASFDAGSLVVRCAFAGGDTPSDIRVVLHTGSLIAVADETGSFRVSVPGPGTRLWVEIDTPAGAVRSAPMWIDHEAELRVGRPEFDVQTRLAGNEGTISSEGLIDIFTLVVEHYKSPVPWAGTRGAKGASAIDYNLEDVFSTGFGRRSYAPVSGGGYLTTDEWSLMNDYFRLGGVGPRNGDPSDNSTDNPDGNPPEPKEPRAPAKPLEPTQVEKLARLIDRAVSSMSSMAFLESRPPPRLAADIRTVALLLGIARRREGMDKARVDSASARLFHALFFGNGSRPLLDLYVEAHPEAPALMQSSDLTAAMTLWIADLINKPEAGTWFNFAATRLAAAHPWLTLGDDEAMDSLERLSVHIAGLVEALPDFWLSWVQGGAAIRALMKNLTDPDQLLATVTRPRIYSGEIVWIGNQFAVAETDFDRKSNAGFFLLGEARHARYQGSRAVPILDVIDAVELPEAVKHTIKQILTPASLSFR
ncbi:MULTISPECIES: hypothetical protein [Mesorhizobium]|uniref:Phospholipase D-like domain-containing protein n=4 Tax=Mesorhizobium TaxID=68287 RepID=Q8KGX1_RHILI|nr:MULTISPECIES: hypothetical protein [Mesorhizobium]MBZ9910313.1 hypothetical protein [Mesorhizobium sp. BR115XR7A]QGX80530.1 hypothetical protein EB234_29590 [Mesorhizobium japonicum R7A]QJF04681.1 hypothetical protein R7A2020_29225 [Mesorhizobium japonicum R7A]QJF10750.1 hypothetical protein HID05_29215 [Mesorhizobium japonicum]QJI86623.1 hypothetical protein HKB46_29225 [Mesorhizobium japonicum]